MPKARKAHAPVAAAAPGGGKNPQQQPTAGGRGGKQNQPGGRGGGAGRGGGGHQPTNTSKALALSKAQAQEKNAPVSIANRYSKPGGGRGFGAPPPVDVLTPTVPPLYPTAPKPSPLNIQINERVPVYKRLGLYFSSNYGVHLPRRAKCGFNVDRYTDRYKAPLTVNADIVHRIGSERLPEELMSTKPILPRGRYKSRVPIKKRALEDLPDEEETTETAATKKPREEQTSADNDVIGEVSCIYCFCFQVKNTYTDDSKTISF